MPKPRYYVGQRRTSVLRGGKPTKITVYVVMDRETGRVAKDTRGAGNDKDGYSSSSLAQLTADTLNRGSS